MGESKKESKKILLPLENEVKKRKNSIFKRKWTTHPLKESESEKKIT